MCLRNIDKTNENAPQNIEAHTKIVMNFHNEKSGNGFDSINAINPHGTRHSDKIRACNALLNAILKKISHCGTGSVNS